MIAILAAIALIQQTPSWHIVAVSSESIDALDTGSIKRENGGAAYSVAHIYPTLSRSGQKFTVNRYWSDCQGRSATMLLIQSYNAAGGLIGDSRGANNLPITDPIRPASAMSKVERAACTVGYRFQMPAISSLAETVRTADALF
jgi:hypothetical protein